MEVLSNNVVHTNKSCNFRASKKRCNTKWENDDCNNLDDGHDALEDARVGSFCKFYLGGKLLDVVILANCGNLTGAVAGNNKTTAVQGVARSLFDGLAFAGKHGFVNFHFAVKYDGVGANLLACRVHQNVVQHNLLRFDVLLLAIA